MPPVTVFNVLASAFDDAIDQGAINRGEVPDTRDFVDLTGEWIAWQTKVAEGSLDCLESGPQRLAVVPTHVIDTREIGGSPPSAVWGRL
jgi:hypothetical protein